MNASAPPNASPVRLVAFTICSKNFLAYARTVQRSLARFHPDVRFFVALCDRVDGHLDLGQEGIEFILPEQLPIPDFLEMSGRYNITELNTAIKPFAFQYLFENVDCTHVAYFDPDILILSRLEELEAMVSEGALAVLTPHITGPAETAEVSDVKMLQFGIYNLGFLLLANAPETLAFARWWGRRLERDCVIRLDQGLFVDQKWADLAPAFIPATRVLRHPGYNVAYWNLSQRQVQEVDGEWRVNGEALRFVHFSGNALDDPEVFSRHSSQFRTKDVGDLARLLARYRELVYEHGHERYRRLPYAFNWSGSAGVNLHAPKTLDQSGAGSVSANGKPRRVLFVDWATPRPDRDAGGATAFNLMKILRELGYAVDFLPTNLVRDPDYTQPLEDLGVRCIDAGQAGTIEAFLSEHGPDYDAAMICRAPIAEGVLVPLRRFLPRAAVILNTSDLHYLRDERQAQLEGSAEKLAAAADWKRRELGVFARCDVVIVMSEVERDELRKHLVDERIELIPLMFLDIPGRGRAHGERNGVVFIGGFPHLPNVDAVEYFCREVWPRVLRHLPSGHLTVVGNAPPQSVRDLEAIPGVEVRGYVKDIGPIFDNARVAVAPLRYGAGIKGKLGTSMSYGVPAVATPVAVEGMGIVDGVHAVVADDPDTFARAVASVHEDPKRWQRMSDAGLDLVRENYSYDVGRERIGRLMASLEAAPPMRARRLESQAEFVAYRAEMAAEFKAQRRLERSLLVPGEEYLRVRGWCACCKRWSLMNVGYMYSYQTDAGIPIPNWREHLDCECGLSNRVRAAFDLFLSTHEPRPEAQIYVTERVTPAYRWLSERFANLQGSEYFGGKARPGEMVDGIRNEDFTALTFADASFDHILSLDVLEHVPDPIAALREAWRCLKPGGTLLFGAPMTLEHYDSVVRARLAPDGSIEHLLPPEYHGNPVDPEGGALCFQYMGWDALARLREIGFESPAIVHYWSRERGYLGVDQFVVTARKPATAAQAEAR